MGLHFLPRLPRGEAFRGDEESGSPIKGLCQVGILGQNPPPDGAELGKISGEQVSQVHKVIQERLNKDRKLARRIKRIIARL